MTVMQILWRPEINKCSQCGCEHKNIRMFTSHGSKTYLCKNCWCDFVLECNISSGPWEKEILRIWNTDIDIILVPEYGTTQAASGWI